MKELIYNEFRKMFLKKRIWVITIALFILSTTFIVVEFNRTNRIIEHQKPEYILKREISYQKNIEESIKELKEKTKLEDKESLEVELKDLENQLKISKSKSLNIEIEIKSPLTPEEMLDKRIQNIERDMKSIPKNDSFYYKLINEYNELKYLKDHNMTITDNSFTAIKFMNRYFSELGIIVIPLIIMIIVGDVVSGECTSGTFKFLLIQPVSRRKILFSKYIVSIVSSLAIVFSIELISFLFVGLVFSFGDINNTVFVGTRYIRDTSVMVNGEYMLKQIENSTYAISMVKYIISMFGYDILVILACTSFGFLISTLINNSMISMIISMASIVIFSVINQIGLNLKMLSLFIFTTHGNVSDVLNGSIIGSTNNVKFTITNGIMALIGTTIICYLISQLVFVKKDFNV